QKGRFHPRQLVDEMERGCRRGTGLPREVFRDLTVELRSIPELRAFRLLKKADLPQPKWNAKLFNHDGDYVACPDAWFDDVGLAVEIDSYEFHFTARGYASTARRNSRYAENGILIVQI